jgi:hypothetical protein
VVTRLECGHARTDPLYNACPLVPHYDRHGLRHFALQKVEIGVTYSCDHKLYQHFIGLRLIEGDLFYF